MRRSIGTLALLLVQAVGASAQEAPQAADPPEARIWLDRGDEPLLQRGDRVRIYYRTAADAYIAIFHIDTDGSVHLLYPRSPDDDYLARAGRDYRLLFPQTPYWFVDEYPGKGYFFMIASPEPFDFGAFDYSRYDRGWDLTQVGRTVYEDPYVAIDEYVARLLPDWQSVPYALDFIAYDVGESHDYPRFLCYDCHGYRTFASWNPYTYACSSFRVVIWDDPYFYPAYRYRGTRVVFAQPLRGIRRFEFKERAVGEAWTPLTRTRQPPLRRSGNYKEAAVAAPPMPEFVPPRRRVAPSDALRDGGRVRANPSGDGVAVPRGGSGADGARSPATPTGTRRPSTNGSGSASSPRIVVPPRTDARPGASRTDQRPTLQRRPSTALPPRSVRPPPSGTRATTGRSLGSRIRALLPGGSSGGSSTRPSTSRPSRGSTARPTPSRPRVQPSRPSGGRSSARPSRPPSRPGGGAKPKRRGKPGGGTSR